MMDTEGPELSRANGSERLDVGSSEHAGCDRYAFLSTVTTVEGSQSEQITSRICARNYYYAITVLLRNRCVLHREYERHSVSSASAQVSNVGGFSGSHN